jgi:hypothetical protein
LYKKFKIRLRLLYKNDEGKKNFFYLFLAISLAALIRGANVLNGSDNLKNGCYNRGQVS